MAPGYRVRGASGAGQQRSCQLFLVCVRHLLCRGFEVQRRESLFVVTSKLLNKKTKGKRKFWPTLQV